MSEEQGKPVVLVDPADVVLAKGVQLSGNVTGLPDARERLDRLEKWLSRLVSESGDKVCTASDFARKVSRVLDGSDTLGITVCVVCKAESGSRIMLYQHEVMRYRYGEGWAEVSHTSGAICDAHGPQSRYTCPCGSVRWYVYAFGQDYTYTWYDAAGERIAECSGCGVRLPGTHAEWDLIVQEVYAKAGYVRGR